MAVVVAGGLGYWMIVPKKPGETVSTATQQTSVTASSQTSFQTSSQTAVQSLTASSTLTSSTMLTETVAWINVSAAHPVSFYLNLLESNGTEPYVQLAKELQEIPDLTNATAVAQIAYLALNATNPEVKEAFELMIKGGTPAPVTSGTRFLGTTLNCRSYTGSLVRTSSRKRIR